MEPQYSKNSGNVPPLSNITTNGVLQYADGATGTPVKIDINGTIDKGFFLSDGEWTCYRRNYFSCVCSYSLTPNYQGTNLQYTPNPQPQGQNQTYAVFGFAMSISAVVADNDGHQIELVQHTPKRDKGPIAKPDKVRLAPKPAQQTHHHHHHHVYHDTGMGGTRGSSVYGPDTGYSQGPNQVAFQTEHTFERIQFKQATANNGKRRAAQQYYHLCVELYADLGPNQAPEQFVKIAFRKSAKMIVRGRSPGHYQNERRGSTSSGPGGSAGSIGGSYNGGQAVGSDFNTSAIYASQFDTSRGGVYAPSRHQHGPLPVEPYISPEEAKVLDTKDEYQYYPGTIYDDNQERSGQNDRVEMFNHQHRSDQQGAVGPVAAGGFEHPDSKVKNEYDSSVLPPLFHPGPLVTNRRCGPFEGKPTSGGYYPTMVPQSGLNITNIT